MTILHLMPGTQNLDQTTLDRLEAVWRKGQTLRRGRILARHTPPLIRLWDGDWNLKGRLVDAIHVKLQWKLNDTGAGTITIPIDHWLATWALDHHRRPTKNIHVTMDKDGARWSGRLKSTRLVKERTGQRYLELNFLHDYEELKHIYIWPNPLTPAAVQFPPHVYAARPHQVGPQDRPHAEHLALGGLRVGTPRRPTRPHRMGRRLQPPHLGNPSRAGADRWRQHPMDYHLVTNENVA